MCHSHGRASSGSCVFSWLWFLSVYMSESVLWPWHSSDPGFLIAVQAAHLLQTADLQPINSAAHRPWFPGQILLQF